MAHDLLQCPVIDCMGNDTDSYKWLTFCIKILFPGDFFLFFISSPAPLPPPLPPSASILLWIFSQLRVFLETLIWNHSVVSTVPLREHWLLFLFLKTVTFFFFPKELLCSKSICMTFGQYIKEMYLLFNLKVNKVLYSGKLELLIYTCSLKIDYSLAWHCLKIYSSLFISSQGHMGWIRFFFPLQLLLHDEDVYYFQNIQAPGYFVTLVFLLCRTNSLNTAWLYILVFCAVLQFIVHNASRLQETSGILETEVKVHWLCNILLWNASVPCRWLGKSI